MLKLTIVTVCYNAEKEIEKTITSVLEQNYKDFEYIIIDGESKDNTISIITQTLKRYPSKDVRLLSESDKGIYDAMNKGINIAKGEWLNFMNAGDVFFSSSVLEDISGSLSNNNDVVYGDFLIEKRCRRMIVKANPDALSNPSSLEMGFNHQASFVKTVLAKKSPFDLRYKLAADFNMMKTLYNEGCRFVYVAIPVVKYDLTGASNQNIWRHRYECLTIVNPNCISVNKIRATTHLIKMTVHSFLARIIYAYFPKLLYCYYDRRNDFVNI